MAATYNFTIEQGADVKLDLVWKDANGTPVDLTGARAKMQLRSNTGAPLILELTTENAGIVITPAEGKIKPIITNAATLTLNFTTAQYQLELYLPDGTIKRLLSGNVTLSKRLINNA